MSERHAEVAVPGVRGLFTYRVPDDQNVLPGSRVLVPFGRRKLTGYVVAISTEARGGPKDLKSISSLLDPLPLLKPPLVELGCWIADYYAGSEGTILKSMLPQGIEIKSRQVFRITPKGEEVLKTGTDPLLELLLEGPRTEKEIREALLRPRLRAALSEGCVEMADELLRPRVSRRQTAETPARSRGKVRAAPRHSLSAAQAEAVARIVAAAKNGGFSPFLLHGVTGSGKTEIYLRAIEEIGGAAIVLVPEISLTPQMVGRFAARFADRIAVLHSRLTARERLAEWERLAQEKATIAVGARSAVFAPVDPALIVVDEEHDPSYKQEEGIRYSARDVAVVRAERARIPILLGSATPSLESFHNAVTGRYTLLSLPERIDGRPMPEVRVVDQRGGAGLFSPPLIEAIRRKLSEKEQTILLLNRRGYAPFLLCTDCGAVPSCPLCSISLTFHRMARRLICHYCGYPAPVPAICFSCSSKRLAGVGVGTERAEEEARLLFPQARIARMDRDTMKGRHAYEQIIDAMEQREIDILIGTQMVAKGHDLPSVTLVGVLLADLALRLPDFRSSERTFALLTQVAGRAGRGERPGEVILQTYFPDHPSIRYAAAHDSRAVYEEELAFRKEAGYPPAGRIASAIFSGPREGAVERAARSAAEDLGQAQLRGLQLRGPAPAPLEKIRGKYRWRLLLRADRVGPIRRAVSRLLEAPPRGSVRMEIDVDPQSLL